MQTTTGTSTTLSMYCKSGVKQQQWDLDCLLTDRTCGTCRPAHRGRASTGCNCESELSIHNCTRGKPANRDIDHQIRTEESLWFSEQTGPWGTATAHRGSVDDRDELQLRNRLHAGHEDGHLGPEDKEGNTARGTLSPAKPALYMSKAP